MTLTPHVTAVLLVAAFTSVGCSKGDEASQQKAPSADAASSQLPTPRAVLAAKQMDEKAPVSNPAAAVASPKSFADGEAAYQAGNYSDAVAIFEHYTGDRPGNAWGHYMLGLSAWKGGDLGKAEQAFEKALSIDPHHVKSLVNSSRVFIEQQRHGDALERLARAAAIEPGSAEVYRLLGRTHGAKGNTAEAVESYRRALELNERDAWSMNNLGLLLLETGRSGEALPLLAKAVELRKDVPAFHNNFGMALEHTGRFKAAATAYHGALAADPGYDKAMRNLARVEAVRVDSEQPLDVAHTAEGAVNNDVKSEVKKPTI